MNLVGRYGELAVLHAALDAVAAGRPRVLVLLGEAGIGKTSLLALAGDRARDRGFELRTGRATEHEADVPFALFDGPTRDPAQGIQQRWQLFRDLATGFDRPPDGPPALIALDDVHWADPASLELLDTIVRHPPVGAHLVLLALRPGPVAEAVVSAARSAARPLDLLELAPLGPEHAVELLPGRSETERARLLEASGGNPLLLTELHRAGLDSPTPLGILAAVGAEVRRLGTAARLLVEAGAVLGDPFVVDVAAETAGLSPTDWPGGLDELVDSGLLVAAESPREYRFRHPAVRTAVREAMSEGSRLHAHARAAAALARVRAPEVARARHLAHSAVPGDLVAAQTLRTAAAAVRDRSPSIAADWLLVAQRVAPPHEVADFGELARVLVQAGRLDEALATAEEGLAMGDGSGNDRLRVSLVAASVERQLGRHDSARRRLTRIADSPVDQSLRAELLAALTLSAYETGNYAAMARSAVDLHATATDDPVLRAVGNAVLAMVRQYEGDPEACVEHADRAEADVRDATDEELVTHGELLTPVPWALMAIERFASAAEISRRSAAATRAAGNLSAAVPLGLPEVLALGLLGRLPEADAAAQQAEMTARLTHNAQAAQWALWARAWVLLERGELAPALAAATESVAVAQGLDDSASVTVARTVLGAVLLAEGHPEDAAELLAAYDVDPSWVCRWTPRLVEAQLSTGRLEEAVAAAARAIELAEASGLRGAITAAHRAAGQVALATDDRVTGLAHALESVEAAAAVGADSDLALAHLLAGRCTEQPAEAVEHLTVAHRLAQQCGARRTQDEAVRELRRRGRRLGRGGARAPGQEGVEALSPREREIADLVGLGRTNREIAARLFLSEKTVESHLSKAFTKLGVTSRAALASRVAGAVRPSGG